MAYKIEPRHLVSDILLRRASKCPVVSHRVTRAYHVTPWYVTDRIACLTHCIITASTMSCLFVRMHTSLCQKATVGSCVDTLCCTAYRCIHVTVVQDEACQMHAVMSTLFVIAIMLYAESPSTFHRHVLLLLEMERAEDGSTDGRARASSKADIRTAARRVQTEDVGRSTRAKPRADCQRATVCSCNAVARHPPSVRRESPRRSRALNLSHPINIYIYIYIYIHI